MGWYVKLGVNLSEKVDFLTCLALLILDQPFATAVLRRSGHDTVSKSVGRPEPFQGGYADFIKYDSINAAINSGAPPRSSMFDDLLYCHTTHVKYLLLTKDPKSVTIFAQKIICSEYMMILHYHRQLVARLAS